MKTLLLSFLCAFSISYSQSDIPISKYLNDVAAGKAEEVKLILPDLMVEYPNDPGVKFLTAAVISDAMNALAIYQDIVNNSPQSTWADDALYRIIQFNVILGDNEAANHNLSILRSRYQTSEFIVPSADLVRTALGIRGNKKEINQANINRNVAPEIAKKNEKKNIEEKKVEEKKVSEEKKQVEKLVEENIKTDESGVKIETTNDAIIIIPNNQNSAKVSEEVPQPEIKNTGKIEVTEKEPDGMSRLKAIVNSQIEKGKSQKEDKTIEKNVKKSDDIATNSKVIENNSQDEAVKKWGLQVAIFEKKEAAEKEKDKYLSQRMRTDVLTKNVSGKQMYAVVIGHYSTKANAEAAKIIINQQCNCEPIIIEK